MVLNPNYALLWRPFENVVRRQVILCLSTMVKDWDVPGNASSETLDKKSAMGKQRLIEKLELVLKIRRIDALDIANKYKKLSTTNVESISSNYDICTCAKIKKATILKYPDILAQKNLKEKLELVSSLKYDIDDTVALLRINEQKLRQLINIELSGEGRLAELSNLLNLPINVLCDELSKKTFLVTIAISKIVSNLDLLKEAGITMEEIHRDLWVLQYSNEYISQRIEAAKAHNLDKFKTWMVRCMPEIQENYVKRRSDNKEILGDSSLAEYLSERLECTVEEAKMLMNKHPALKHKSMKKMKEILDFLMSQGMQPYHICRVPKILLHSVETTRTRLKELEPYGRHLDSLYVLTKSKKQYLQFLETLVKTNKVKAT